jgi:hypothetical protein
VGDGEFTTTKMILGFDLCGAPGNSQTVSLPEDKTTAYIEDLKGALDNPQHYISFQSFKNIHGRLVHAAMVILSLASFLTPCDQILAKALWDKLQGCCAVGCALSLPRCSGAVIQSEPYD